MGIKSCRYFTSAFFKYLAISGLAVATQNAWPQATPASSAPKTPSVAAQPISKAEAQPHLDRGKDLYLRNCFICHQLNGQGIPGIYPPLAKSDLVEKNLERAIKAVVEGISGPIEVLGKKYNGAMPPVAINDEEVADVFTYVLNNWGNPGGALAAETIKDVRSRSAYKTFESLQSASAFAPLPAPPEGFALREVVRLPQRCVRLASDGHGRVIYALTADGDVYRVETETGQTRQILWPKSYLITRGTEIGGLTFTTVGMTMAL